MNANKRAKKYFKLIDDEWDFWRYTTADPRSIDPYYPDNINNPNF